MSATPAGRPRLLVFNQYYWPSVEADGQLLTQLCEGLAGDWDVTVVTGALPRAGAARTLRGGVHVVRVASTAFERRSLPLRGVNYASYFALALAAGLTVQRPDVVLCLTNPPFLGDAAYLVARRFRVPLVVVSNDIFPETAVVLGRLENRLLVRLLGGLTRFYLRRAERVVAIGETMKRRLEEKSVAPERVRVIPNWADTHAIRPFEGENEWARRQRLGGRFVVMHSGNVGQAQDLDSLVRAAALLHELERLAVVVVGSGSRLGELVELAGRLRADRVRFLPYQPRSMLSQSLSAAALHVVGLAPGLAGYVVPSRIYGVLAVGRAVVVAADDESETAQLVRSVGCGVVVPAGDPHALADVIRSAYEGKYDLAAMGRRGREYAVGEGSREVAVARYRELLDELRR